MSAHRYVAYTSDIGESFRPVAHPYWIRTAYGISWLYLTGDVAHEGYKAYLRNQSILHPDSQSALPPPSSPLQDKLKGLKDTLKSTEGVKTGTTPQDNKTTTGSILTGGEVVAGRIPAIEDYRAVMAQRAIFQGLASMGLPAFTIHSIVRYSGRAMKDVKNKTIRTWGPIGVCITLSQFHHTNAQTGTTMCTCESLHDS
jgi:fission process protein 1